MNGGFNVSQNRKPSADDLDSHRLHKAIYGSEQFERKPSGLARSGASHNTEPGTCTYTGSRSRSDTYTHSGTHSRSDTYTHSHSCSDTGTGSFANGNMDQRHSEQNQIQWQL